MPLPRLCIDFHGTLCHNIFWRSADLQTQEKIREHLFKTNKHIHGDWMLGKYASEDINKLLADHLKIPPETLWQIFVEDCKTMRISPSVLKKIQLLKNKFETILLTDNMDCLTRFTIPATRLEKSFDKIISSHETKRFKKDTIPLLFAKSPKRQSFLIDDSRHACELFEKHGGTAFLATETHNLEYYLDSLLENKR